MGLNKKKYLIDKENTRDFKKEKKSNQSQSNQKLNKTFTKPHKRNYNEII